MKYIFTIMAILLPIQIMADDKFITIYQDADLSRHIESSDAIQKGIEVAFSEINKG